MSNLLICEDCHGAGRVGMANCKNCHGRGAGVFAGKYFLYWNGVKSLNDVILERLHKFVNKVIDAVLILFGIFGFLNFAYFWYANNFLNFFKSSFWETPNRYLLIFFFSLLGIL